MKHKPLNNPLEPISEDTVANLEIELYKWRQTAKEWNQLFKNAIMEDQAPYKTSKLGINPREFRIGNLVKYSDGCGYAELSALAIHDIEQGLLKVEPIQLTEEILIKAGFRRTDVLEYIDDNTGFIFAQYGNYGYELTKGEYSICFTRTVSHLQNLYFALTGCELEIKL